MVHVTCDLCGKGISTGADHRFVVKIEVFASSHPAVLTEADLDDDHLEAVGALLRSEEESVPDPDADAPPYKGFRYDLCPECHKKFLRDPLSREAAQKFDFSEN